MAKRANKTTELTPVFEVFRTLMMNATPDTMKDVKVSFAKKMGADRRYLELLAFFYFDKKAATWGVTDNNKGIRVFNRKMTTKEADSEDIHMPAASRAVAQTAASDAVRSSITREEREAQTASDAKKLKKALMLDIVLPLGVSLREANGAQCDRTGNFFKGVAKLVKPTEIVGEKVKEKDIRNIARENRVLPDED